MSPTTAPHLLALLLVLAIPSTPAAEPARIIFDSDMSSDHDDVGDIAVLHGLASLGECRILAMMVSSMNGGSALCMDAINTWYGRPGIPIGVPPGIGGIGGYAGQIAAEFPHRLASAAACLPAADLYRRILAGQPDGSVTIVTTGYLTNLKALLQSAPDAHSPLAGPELVRRKVRLLACAGGALPRGDEFNFRSSGDDSAFVVVNAWPARVMYIGFDIGQPIRTAGPLRGAPAGNPIRRVYVDIKNQVSYPSWGQIAICYAVRGPQGLWGAVTRGRNNADRQGGNWWTADPDPTGDQEQGYLLEVVRSPVRATLDALMLLPPNDGSPSLPGPPTNLRATVAAGRIDLQWTDNACNETGFVIERRDGGVFRRIGEVAAGTTTFADGRPPAPADLAYRVTARNAIGDSQPAELRIYSGWTEINLDRPGDLPLYSRYQYGNLRWARGGDVRPAHVVLNDDSQHGRSVTVDVDVGALGSEGAFHVYVLYQGPDDWYRLSADGAASRFEKRIKGVTTQIGPAAPGVDIGNGSDLQPWRIAVTPAGSLSFAIAGAMVLSVQEPLDLAGGRIGLGGRARTPLWENFRFASE